MRFGICAIFSACAFLVFILTFVFTPNEKANDGIFPGSSRAPIPRILHQIFLVPNQSSPSRMPSRWIQARQSCLRENNIHKWTYTLWSNESIMDFLSNHYPAFIPTWTSYRFLVQRVDSIRYLLLYHFGGIYLDLDIGCRTSLDPFLDMVTNHSRVSYMLAETSPFGYANDVLAASPRNPFFRQLVSALPFWNKNFVLPYLTEMLACGPLFLSLQWYWATKEVQDGLHIIPAEMYGTEVSPIYFAGGHSSWHEWDAPYVLYLGNHLRFIFISILFVTCYLLIIYFCYCRKNSGCSSSQVE